MEKIKNALSKNSLLHGLLMAVYGALGAALLPLISELSSGHPVTMPDFNSMWRVALGAAMLYLLKNLSVGSSNLGSNGQPVDGSNPNTNSHGSNK